MSLHVTAEHRRPETPEPDNWRVVHVRYASVKWCIRETWRGRLVEPSSPDWFTLDRNPRAQCVKSGFGRTVWRVQLAYCVLIAKVFDETALPDQGRRGVWTLQLRAVKRWLLGSAAEVEFRKALAAERRHVPVFRCLAAGRQTVSPSRSVLLSAELPDALALPQVWDQIVGGHRGGDRRRAVMNLIEPVAKLYALAHARGFVHLDGHPNNVLAYTGPSGELKALFVDLHSSRLKPAPVARCRAARSLGQLDHFFKRRATRGERIRFLRRYLDLRDQIEQQDATGWDRRTWAKGVAKAVQHQAIRLAWQRDRRLRGNNKYFATLSLNGGWRAVVALALERRHLFPEHAIRDRTQTEWRETLKPLCRTLADASTVQDRQALRELRLLELRPSGLWQKLLWSFGGSPWRKAFVRCHQLRHRDIRAELILGFAEHRTAGLVDAAVLLLPRRDSDASCNHGQSDGVLQSAHQPRTHDKNNTHED